MWFKNTQLFQLTSSFTASPEELAQMLETYHFEPCLPSLPDSHGWITPFEHVDEGPLVYAANGFSLFCLQIEEKILPVAVIRRHVNDKVKEMEKKLDRKISSKEKLRIKDDVIFSLLPRAFTKITRIHAYLDTKNKQLVLNTTNTKHTELFMSAVQKSIDQLRLAAPELKDLSKLMTGWLQKAVLPKAFSIEKDCVLQDDSQQSRVIRCKQQDLSAQPIQALLTDGCAVKQVALDWQDRVQFMLSNEFLLQSIKYDDALIEQARDVEGSDEMQQFAADFVIMTETLRQLFAELLVLVVKKKSTQSAKDKVAEPA